MKTFHKTKAILLAPLSTVFLAASLTACLGNGTHAEENAKDISADSLFRLNRDTVFAHADEYTDTVTIHYARGLHVKYQNNGTVIVTITNPDPEARHQHPTVLLLSKKPTNRTARTSADTIALQIPVHGAVCMTALQLSNFTALGREDKIVGIVSLRHLFNQRIKEQIRQGHTARIGHEGTFDTEQVLAAHPDFIFVSASKRGGFEQLKDCGVPLVPHHGYKETDPLGQAEWIKLAGLLTGESRKANAIFADIERKYNTLKQEVAQLKKPHPTVLSGRQVRDGWYVMGGQSYMARIFHDAGADYIYDNEETGGQTLDFESVYAKGIHADYWQIDGAFDGQYSYETLAEEDSRYADLDAFKKRHVLCCDFSTTPYRELAPVEPHYLLADFVKAFHPSLLPNYTPHYYCPLGQK